jgi:hypothetical protein
MKLFKRFLLTKTGQTSVELILMIAVSASLGIAFKKKMEDFLIRNPNSFIALSLRNFESRFQLGNAGRYQRFPIR